MSKSVRCCAAVAALGSLVMVLAACSDEAGSPDPAAALRTTLDEIRRTYEPPGITAAVALPDGRVVSAASGYADTESETPMTPESRMLAASIGKTFVAATVVALAEEGRLELDQPISAWLGERDWFDRLPNADAITVRHLLSHRSGLPDHVHMDAFAGAWGGGREMLSPETLIGFVLDQPPLDAPGNGFAYSDTGYLLLGLVIEAVTGERYENAVQSRFLSPLGLGNTGPSNTVHIENLATGYVSDASGLGLPRRTTDADGTMRWNPAIEWTGGGLYSTSADLARWGQALFSGRAVSPGAVDNMVAGRPTSGDDPAYRYGLGVAVWTETPWGPSYGHRGWIPGYVSSLRYFPDYGTAIAFQVNTDIGIIGEQRPVVLEIEHRLASLAFSDTFAGETAAVTGDR